MTSTEPVTFCSTPCARVGYTERFLRRIKAEVTDTFTNQQGAFGEGPDHEGALIPFVVRYSAASLKQQALSCGHHQEKAVQCVASTVALNWPPKVNTSVSYSPYSLKSCKPMTSISIWKQELKLASIRPTLHVPSHSCESFIAEGSDCGPHLSNHRTNLRKYEWRIHRTARPTCDLWNTLITPIPS